MSERRYTDEELARIVRRAALLQAAEPTEDRHSLADIQAIAEQVGIPPELVQRAAQELPRNELRPGTLTRYVFGPNSRVVVSGAAPGTPAPSALENLQPLLQQLACRTGGASRLGNGFEWWAGNRYADLLVTAMPRGREPVVRREADYEGWRRMPYVLAVIGAGYLGLVVSESHGPAVVGVAVTTALVAGWALARATWGLMASRLNRRLLGLRDSLLARIAAAPSNPEG